MKTIIISIALLLTVECAFSQQTSAERDSVAQTAPFQKKVRMATLKAANNILADPQQAVYTLNYGQVIISEPTGNGWLSAMSYGCMTNVAINYDSSDSDIEF